MLALVFAACAGASGKQDYSPTPRYPYPPTGLTYEQITGVVMASLTGVVLLLLGLCIFSLWRRGECTKKNFLPHELTHEEQRKASLKHAT